MFSHISKTALRALARAEFVVMSTRTHKEAIAARLGEIFRAVAPPDPDGTPPDSAATSPSLTPIEIKISTG